MKKEHFFISSNVLRITVVTSCFLIACTPSCTQTGEPTGTWMFTAEQMSLGMQTGWSNSLYYHDGKYYITQECSTKEVQEWNATHRGTDRLSASNPHNLVAVALYSSDDGVFWKYEKNIVHFTPDQYRNAWTECGANNIWQIDDGRFVQMCQVEDWIREDGTRRSANEVYVSSDMLNWERMGPEYNLENDPCWYEPDGRFAAPDVLREPDGWYGQLTTGRVVMRPGMSPDYKYSGLIYSKDGLQWKPVEPVPFDRIEGPAEICAWFKNHGIYYVATDNIAATRCTRIYTSPHLKGPYLHQERNPILTNTPWMRFQEVEDELLACTYCPPLPGVVHQGETRRSVANLPLQKAVFDADGTLRLNWWAGNDLLKGEVVDLDFNVPVAALPVMQLSNRVLDITRGFVVEGTCRIPSYGPENLALTATASASVNSEIAGSICDGENLTAWKTYRDQPGSPHWVQLDFGKTVPLGAVKIEWGTSREMESVNIRPELSDDGLAWQPVASPMTQSPRFTGVGSYPVSVWYNLDTRARYLRFTVPDSNGFNTHPVKEIYVYGEPRFDMAADDPRPGVYLEYAEGNSLGKSGALFLVNGGGMVDFGDADGGVFIPSHGLDRDRNIEGEKSFRLVVKDLWFLFYLDEELMHAAALPEMTGRIGITGSTVSDVTVWHAPESGIVSVNND